MIDDDVDLTRHLGHRLGAGGFMVDVVPDEAAALAQLGERSYDLVLLDVMLPGGDGFELLRRIVGDRRDIPVPVIVLTAEGQLTDVIRALRLGADDYVVKPFDTDEVEARIRTVLRRTGQMRDLSPLTGLPGNRAIAAELERRIIADEPLAVAHVDIDEFKAINDAYGFLRGDGVITFCARCLRLTAAETPDAFVGHVGGDDFVVALPPGGGRRLLRRRLRRLGGRDRRPLRRRRRRRGWDRGDRPSRGSTAGAAGDTVGRCRQQRAATARFAVGGVGDRRRDEGARQAPSGVEPAGRPPGRAGRRRTPGVYDRGDRNRAPFRAG